MADRWQPDRTRGVFETLLVVAGAPVELDAHLRRLNHSLEALYGRELPGGVDEELRRAAEGTRLGRLRLTVAPVEDALQLDLLAGGVEPEAFFPPQGLELRTRDLRGGLGAHKWTDRKGINRPAPGEAGALIVDEGEVLEAGWANLFAIRGGTLFTPPLDGRLLPGTTRAALLELAPAEGIESHEQPLRVDNLFAADEVFLTGSIRGIEPALELDGQPLPGCGDLSRRLAAALRRRWGLTDGWGHPEALAAAPTPDRPSR